MEAQTNQLSYPQAHIQGFELVYPNIYSIYDLLECVKGPVLRSHSHRISMTQGNSQVSKRSLGEGPVLMVYQKPETLNQTNDSLQ